MYSFFFITKFGILRERRLPLPTLYKYNVYKYIIRIINRKIYNQIIYNIIMGKEWGQGEQGSKKMFLKRKHKKNIKHNL